MAVQLELFPEYLPRACAPDFTEIEASRRGQSATPIQQPEVNWVEMFALFREILIALRKRLDAYFQTAEGQVVWRVLQALMQRPPLPAPRPGG